MSRDQGGASIVTVKIAGEEHNLRTSADPQYTKECARFLDERIREIRETVGVVEVHRATILAALSLTDRYLRTERELERLRREVASRATNLVRRIEDEEVRGVEDGSQRTD